ncbi:MAG: hypothetical protein JWQ42_4691, partial [Edaphobacter sp.]|nr:hypothetical protein [Edaphobacter sp.]
MPWERATSTPMNGGHVLRVLEMPVCLLKSRCQDFPMEDLSSPSRLGHGGVMRTTLARQELMEPHAVAWAFLSMQTSIAVRRLLPQLRARLAAGMVGLAVWKSAMI